MPNELFKGISFDLEDNNAPVAVILPTDQEVVTGAIAKLDGRSSFDPQGHGLTYTWTFSQVPIGSQVQVVGFTALEDDGSIVSFAPDVTGTYEVQLVVNDGSLDSDPNIASVDVRVILVPNHQGIDPDASFIWNYLSDFWTLVPDRVVFESFWSSAIQITAGELLKLYQYQYNKSIRDIQDVIQKRWIAFSPFLVLDRTDVTFILTDDAAGAKAATYVIDPATGLPTASQTGYSNAITVGISDGDVTKTDFGLPTSVGLVLQMGDRSFTLSRTNQAFRSVDFGTDGISSSTATFSGSQFTAGMVGSTLRILTPGSSIKGDFPIASFVSSTQVTISNPPIGITWAGQSGLKYTVISATPTDSTFFVDQPQVPVGLENQFWRLSATLISNTINFELQGVSAGDSLQVEITRTDLNILSTFYAQVVSVDRNRLGFVLNLTDLVDGVAASWMTPDIQVTLATDLIVPGLSTNLDGSLAYGLDAANIKAILSSALFKRQFFERQLATDDEIDVGLFTITARPIQIIRNKKIAVDPTIVSIPILQEYIKQPTIIVDGGISYFVANDARTPVSRTPYLLSENLDFVIDNESSISGICQVQQGLDEIDIPNGDLIDRSVEEGDTITIALGVTDEVFQVARVLAADKIRVLPLPTISSNTATFTITRRIAGTFIRFIDASFTKTSPAPERLWSEVTYFDNGEAIEGNFGLLVGVKREDLAKVGAGIPYKSAVAGLMYALSKGPTISNMALSAQILLGLTFAQNAGVITEIDPGFRLRPDGSPLYGRILIDGRDKNNIPTGVTNIYFYPEGRQILDSVTNNWIPAVPDFSGIGINPTTNVEYVVGDAVTQFAPLSKGVQIQEYLTTPSWIDSLVAQGDIASQLRKYHAFEVLVNADLITSTDADLVAQFLQQVKAHYVRLTSGLLKQVEDFVTIDDVLTFGRLMEFFETADLGTPTAPMIDQADSDGAVLTLSDGTFYTRYLTGDDLSTTQGSSSVSSASGGFINPRGLLIESWDPPLVRHGDVLMIQDDDNHGFYPITNIASDTSISLALSGAVFKTDVNQTFVVYRPVSNPIWLGVASVTTGGNIVSLKEIGGAVAGIGSAGVAVGDLFVFANLSVPNSVVSKIYTIVTVTPSITTPTITLDSTIEELTGQYTGSVVREGLLTSDYVSSIDLPNPTFYVSASIFDFHINFVDTGPDLNSWLNLALLRPGSEIIIDGIPYEVMRFEPATRRAVVSTPLLAAYTNKQVSIKLRPARPSTPVGMDFLDRIPFDSLEMTIVSSNTTGDAARTFTGSTDVTLTATLFSDLGTNPGDCLTLLAGADSTRDVGNGPGIYPIREVIGGATIRLMDQLTATGTFQYGILRKVPNEG